ncbi:GNAT superfamily N-acetyltransferase [Virgibacillus natechei]|uniref:GNAT superfamily N-acetyltransferase n=1 Tax=Virgibacillus natechei TaxID=1216297 RepID=A0ABS4IDV5_9BACI|nr:GNAT family N-acetyltransferase [Virgibacillus natechei]MBP1969122.1 GNAT superfamily N-acetyltransferase [Virgibacillus natechei]UZD14388.1 GNAT family N-acetyltransferase [Virgibacillus natechei]
MDTTITIRLLQYDDYPQVEALDTGIEDDYVKNIFERLVVEPNCLFGVFQEGQLVSMGGYTVYAKNYAMLGRLRSDRRYKGNGFSTSLMSHMIHTAFQQNDIQWVGANTEEHNRSAQRVMEKNRLTNYVTLHNATTKDTSSLESGAKPWNSITDLQKKKDWVEQTYVKTAAIFPYECYYPFPGATNLFQEEDLKKWSFYENDDKTRFVITKNDQKKNHYLHAVYPWNDFASQKGLWETISNDYHKLKKETGDDTYIWMDLTKEEAHSLPHHHPFELPSPWMLFGVDRARWEQL